jgi:glycosyltransferase involved in cell wall biosynthesis
MDPNAVADGRDALALSVVIIAENEADRIEGCIESVIAAAERAVPSFEIILVDSASSDETVDLASEYPITILRIPEEETVSCGAGRYVGDQVTNGELILHVDGDMRLSETWLTEAVTYLNENPNVAAVEGWLNESESETVTDVQKVGGVMCYDADALYDVGGFDPFLLGHEDVELGYRLSAAGYRLARLPSVSAEHPPDDGVVGEQLRRWRHGYQFAPGQAIRGSLDRPQVLWMMIARQRYKLLLGGWLVLGVVSLGVPLGFSGWLVASAIGFGVLVTNLGFAGAVQFLLGKLRGLIGLFYGLRLSKSPAEQYPIETVVVVQEGTVLGHAGEADAGSVS